MWSEVSRGVGFFFATFTRNFKQYFQIVLRMELTVNWAHLHEILGVPQSNCKQTIKWGNLVSSQSTECW